MPKSAEVLQLANLHGLNQYTGARITVIPGDSINLNNVMPINLMGFAAHKIEDKELCLT